MARVRFQLDEHIPRSMATGLRRRGIDVLTAAEAGVLGAPGFAVLASTHATGRVLVTNDDDFLRLHYAGHQHAGIAYCHQGARTLGRFVADLLAIREVLEASEMLGRVEYV